MDIKQLSEQLSVSEEEISQLIEELNSSYNLNMPLTGELTSSHYDVVRSLLDRGYMIRRLYQVTPVSVPFIESEVFNEWVQWVDLSGLSTVEIEQIAAGGPYTGSKKVSRLMRFNGYESKVVYLGGEQQGRRWFKVGASDIKVAKVKAKKNHNVSFL